mmetsp:Transcript_13535/g.28836  ORF Transcript_13535/g.28836 Transcript_13535/m.28836 type:complete len:399 (+) Transcript_13535:504-1700(+)
MQVIQFHLLARLHSLDLCDDWLMMPWRRRLLQNQHLCGRVPQVLGEDVRVLEHVGGLLHLALHHRQPPQHAQALLHHLVVADGAVREAERAHQPHPRLRRVLLRHQRDPRHKQHRRLLVCACQLLHPAGQRHQRVLRLGVVGGVAVAQRRQRQQNICQHLGRRRQRQLAGVREVHHGRLEDPEGVRVLAHQQVRVGVAVGQHRGEHLAQLHRLRDLRLGPLHLHLREADEGGVLEAVELQADEHSPLPHRDGIHVELHRPGHGGEHGETLQLRLHQCERLIEVRRTVGKLARWPVRDGCHQVDGAGEHRRREPRVLGVRTSTLLRVLQQLRQLLLQHWPHRRAELPEVRRGALSQQQQRLEEGGVQLEGERRPVCREIGRQRRALLHGCFHLGFAAAR